MSTRARLETEIDELQEKINNLPADTPKEIREALEQELVDKSFDLNNFEEPYDNNDYE